MQFTQGSNYYVQLARKTALHFIGMDGDGAQTPGAVVVVRNKTPGPEFVVRFVNTEQGGAGGSEYESDLGRAIQLAKSKARRYDPTGKLRRSFSAREEQAALAQPGG